MRLAKSCWVSPAALRAEVSRRRNMSYSRVRTDFKIYLNKLGDLVVQHITRY